MNRISKILITLSIYAIIFLTCNILIENNSKYIIFAITGLITIYTISKLYTMENKKH